MLESQFDDNVKFKQTLAEKCTDMGELRLKPLGRDKDAISYWFFMDSEFTVRLFQHNEHTQSQQKQQPKQKQTKAKAKSQQQTNDCDETWWKIIAKYVFFFFFLLFVVRCRYFSSLTLNRDKTELEEFVQKLDSCVELVKLRSCKWSHQQAIYDE